MPKKRANGEGSIRRKPSGTWEGRYSVGRDPNTGKNIQRSVSAKTQAECKAKLRQAIQDNRGVPLIHTGSYTVAEWCRLWFETYSKPNIRESTARSYSQMIEKRIIPNIGHIKLTQLTTAHIQRMYTETRMNGRIRKYDKEKNPTLANSYVRRLHMVLSGALKQAVKERIIPYNPCDNCRIPPKEKKEMKIIPPEKVGDYLRCAAQNDVLAMFYLELTSGLRRGELTALLWEDLDVEHRILTVNKQLIRMGGVLQVTTPKTQNSIRKVVLPQHTVELLCDEHSHHPDSPLMFPSPRTGDHWSPDAVSRVNKRLLEQAGIDKSVRFHDLRHTFATLAMQSGVDVKTLAGMLGHYSAGFTLDTYTHVTNQMQYSAAEKIGGFMESATAEPTPEPEPPTPTGAEKCKVVPFPRVG